MRTLLVHITSILFLLLALTTAAQAESREGDYFFVLNHRNGMLDDNVLQMLQLPDDRIAIMTNGVSIFMATGPSRRCDWIPRSTLLSATIVDKRISM